MSRRRLLALSFLFFEFSLGFLFVVHGPVDGDIENLLLSPSWAHPFGTDSIGRDLFIRSLQGLSVSGALAALAATGAGLVGLFWGAWSGWSGGRTDLFLMRLLETLEGLPDLLLAVVLVLLFRSLFPLESEVGSFIGLVLALVFSGWFEIARQSRALTLRERQLQYIEAARALGMSRFRLLRGHIWPNIQDSIWILVLLQIPGFILFEASLSFFGFGLRPPIPSLGQIFLEGWKMLSLSPHLIVGPTLLLFFTLLAFRGVLPRSS